MISVSVFSCINCLEFDGNEEIRWHVTADTSNDDYDKDFDTEDEARDYASSLVRRLISPHFYQSDDWRRVRYRALKLHGNRCQCCGAGPSFANPIHVDHVKPISRYPELALELSNLQILCRDCNLGKSNIDQTDWRPAITALANASGFLVSRKKNRRAHIWTGADTICRMASTGGLPLKKYLIVQTIDPDHLVCEICLYKQRRPGNTPIEPVKACSRPDETNPGSAVPIATRSLERA